MTWFLDCRVQAVGGGVPREVAVYQDSALMTIADLQEAAHNQEVVFATHGFNVNRQEGRDALSRWQEWLTLPQSTTYVAVLWPGDTAWIPAIDYPIEGNEAIAAGKLLAAFILKNLSSAGPLSFTSHSLGARVVLQAIRGIAGKVRVKNLLLMAGAIDDTCLTDEYRDAAKAVEKIFLLASSRDDVLALAFPVGNPFAGIAARGSPYWHAALGREEPVTTADTTVEAGWQIPDAWAYGHHNYLPSEARGRPCVPIPQLIPGLTSADPAWALGFEDWRAAWSAAILSTRFG